MSNIKEVPLNWRVVYLSLIDDASDPVIVGRLCGEQEARGFAKDFAEDDAAMAVVSNLRNGEWYTEHVVWDKDYTEEAEAALDKFPPSVKSVFYDKGAA